MGNKCPCISAGARTKNSNDEYVVNEETTNKNNKEDKKKKASKYSVPSDGLDNSGFDEVGGENQAGGFTNLANIAPNGDGPKIYRNGSESQEEIHIEYGKDNSERPIDVPGVKYVNRSPLADPNHNKLNNSKDQGGGAIYHGDDDEIIDTRLRLPSANLDLDNVNNAHKKQQQHVNPAFDDTESQSSVEEKPDNNKDISSNDKKIDIIENSASKFKEYDSDSLSSKSGKSSNSEKVFGSRDDKINDVSEDEGRESVHEEDIDFDMDINDHNKEHTKHKTFEANFDLTKDNKPQIENADVSTYEALMQLKQADIDQNKLILEGATDLDKYESSDFDLVENKKTVSRSSSSSDSSEEEQNIKHYQSNTHETHFSMQGNEISEINRDSNQGVVLSDMQSLEEKTSNDDEPVFVKLGKDSYNSLLKETNPKDDSDTSDGNEEGMQSEVKVKETLDADGKPWFLQGTKAKEENMEVEEIVVLIEKLEDSLVTDMTGDIDAEVLSRNIVEKLDEISALREQAEIDLPIETVIQQMEDYDDDDEEEEEEFETEQDIIDWYNKRMDELNEAVGMDLLEMSMVESLDDEKIRPLFKQHSETQSYFIKKRLIELEKLRKKKLVTNQKGLFEPHLEGSLELQRPTRKKFPESEHNVDYRNQNETYEELTIDDLKDLRADELEISNLNSGNENNDNESKSISDIQFVTTGANVNNITSDTIDSKLEEKLSEFSNTEVHTDMGGAVRETDTTQQEKVILTNGSLYENKPNHTEKLNSEPDIFDETEISFGVYPFVSPSKSEEDLWRGVEGLPSDEIISNDEAMQKFDMLESNNLVFTQTGENNHTESNRDTNVDFENKTEPKTENDSAKHMDTGNTNIDFQMTTTPTTKAKVISMYDSDSDSSDQNSISEDEIVATSEQRNPSFNNNLFHSSKSSDDERDTINNQEENIYSTPSSVPVITTTLPSDDSKSNISMDENKSEISIEEIQSNHSPDESESNNSEDGRDPTNFSGSPEKHDRNYPTKPSAMYGSDSSDESESESEELIKQAFELEKQQQEQKKQFSTNKESIVDESEIVAHKVEKRNISLDMEFPSDDEEPSAFVHTSSGAKFSEQFETDNPDDLECSQNQANDLLAEIQAISDKTSNHGNHSDIELVISDSEYIPDTTDNMHVHSDSSFGAPVYNPPDENEVLSFENNMDNMLLHLSMQPIPPIEAEEDTLQTSTVNVCSKETGEPYPQNVHIDDINSTEIVNNHQKLERRHTKEIEIDDSTDTDDTEGLIEAAYNQDDKKSHSHDSSVEEDPDTEDIIEKYHKAMKLKPAKPIYDDSDSDSSTLEESSEEEDPEEDFEAKVELRETLKDDIKCSLHQMTQNDFKNLMDMYRKERSSLKHMRDQEKSRVNESLWEKLQKRKEAVDQYVHDGEQHSKSKQVLSNGTSVGTQVQPESHATGVGSHTAHTSSTEAGDESDSSEASEEHAEDEEVEESLILSEELTQTIQLMDLEIVQNAGECENNDELNELLQEHFELTEKMRKDKEASLSHHRDKVKQRLMERNNKNFSDSSSEDSCNEENTTDKDTFIDKEMINLKNTYLDAVKTRDAIGEQELHDIIVQYREDQQELIRKREYEKLRINEKLRERLREKKEHTDLSNDEVTHTVPNLSDDTNEFHQLDAEFYEDLYRRHGAGELDEEDMGILIEEHLDQIEDFKRKVQSEMRQRKKARTKMSESIKMKEAGLMINADKEDAEKIRNLREQEKRNADKKLKEKLQKKEKKYDDTPEVPPPKRPTKNKREERRQQRMQDYENVEYEC